MSGLNTQQNAFLLSHFFDSLKRWTGLSDQAVPIASTAEAMRSANVTKVTFTAVRLASQAPGYLQNAPVIEQAA